MKKLFPCTDSAVVEGLKVINEVTIETGFLCISTIKESEEGGVGAYSRGALV